MCNEIVELEKFDFSYASKEELLSVIDNNKFVFQIRIYPNSNEAILCLWGYKIGYFSYPLHNREKEPWDLTFCHFTLDKVDDNSYDDLTYASELFGFDDNMSKKDRIIKWRELYNDSLHWKLNCEYNDLCEETFSEKVLCERIHNEIEKDNLQKIYIVPKDWQYMHVYAKMIMTLFLDEHKDFISESRVLD